MIHFFVLLLGAIASFSHAAHLSCLSRMMSSAAVSAVRCESFPRHDPFLFIATHNNNLDPAASKFEHAIKPFNNGHGLLISMIQRTGRCNRHTYGNNNIAELMLANMDIKGLEALLQGQNKRFDPLCEGQPDIIKSSLFAARKHVELTQCRNDLKELYLMRMNSRLKGTVAAAFRCAQDHDVAGKAMLYKYAIFSNWDTLMNVDYVQDSLEFNESGWSVKNWFDHAVSNWCVETEGDFVNTNALFKLKLLLDRTSSSESSTQQVTPLIEAFAEQYLGTERGPSARLVAINLAKLRNAVMTGQAQ